ncbi:MAG: hypothetical protein IJZ74_12220 [Clostridia bacterium]|nr:hypothetical protein [Clostridia bacterium]
MKKLIALTIAMLLMLPAAALAFDTEELLRTENCTVFENPGTLDTVVRPMNQPFMGEMDDGTLAVFIDYVEKIDLDVTLVRVMVSMMIYEPAQAEEVTFTVGGKAYTFTADCRQSEYDGVYMDDYTFCLTDESLPFLKALAQQKKDDPITVCFSSGGEQMMTGRVVIPGDDAAWIYDRYIDLGGKKQSLKELDGIWPCKIEKVK